MQDFVTFTKDSRTVVRPNPSQENPLLTVFVGVFNGEIYLDKLVSGLRQQELKDCRIIVVDNKSTDESWEKIQRWNELFANDVIMVRNHMNLTATGSISANMDLVTTPWVTFLHQDDIYLREHLSTLTSKISKCSKDTIAISTEMGSINTKGTQNYITPRAIWLLKNKSQQGYFIANLHAHIIPWGATAFRTDVFQQVLPPWHTTSFPDTEMVLKLCSYGKFINIPKCTMLYRENEMSESHSINEQERKIGATAALARVFASEEFRILARGVSAEERSKFSREVDHGIEVRLGPSDLASIVKLIAKESLLEAWNYSETVVLEVVSATYNNIGADQAAELLKKILNHYEPNTEPITNLHFGSLLQNIAANNDVKRNMTTGVASLILNPVLRFIPYFLRRLILQIILKVRVFKKPAHPWNFNV